MIFVLVNFRPISRFNMNFHCYTQSSYTSKKTGRPAVGLPYTMYIMHVRRTVQLYLKLNFENTVRNTQILFKIEWTKYCSTDNYLGTFLSELWFSSMYVCYRLIIASFLLFITYYNILLLQPRTIQASLRMKPRCRTTRRIIKKINRSKA